MSEVVIEVPDGISLREIRKIVREVVVRYLRERGVSEEDLRKIRIKVEAVEDEGED